MAQGSNSAETSLAYGTCSVGTRVSRSGGTCPSTSLCQYILHLSSSSAILSLPIDIQDRMLCFGPVLPVAQLLINEVAVV